MARPAPSCYALVNPQALSPGHPLQALCSAGLAFKLAHALLKMLRQADQPGADQFDLRESVDLVALGTIADIVPLTGENRILARYGLGRLSSSRRPGINALKRVAGLGGAERISSYEVGFQLGPRLNAAGRLETALDALELLTTDDLARAEMLAEGLNDQNQKRQALEQEILEKALAAVRARFVPERDYVIVEGDSTWHVGVVGIVASRILREFNRPVIIFGSDGSHEWRGSGRSIEDFDLAGGLRECSDLLVKHGGHAMAAGVTLSPVKLPDFRARLNELARARLNPEAFHPRLRLDAAISLQELTFPVVKSFEALHPIGHSNPPVQFAARSLSLTGVKRRFGTGEKHLRFAVSDGTATHQALWWSCPPDFEFPPRFDLAFAPELNEFNGTYAIQLKVLDLRASDK
jgi:single-stranded-DNA-specific exonuclease